MKSEAEYNPSGVEFFDAVRQCCMKFVTDGPYRGWIVYRHPDGQWVTLRRATDEDIERLAETIAETSKQQARVILKSFQSV